MDKLAQVPIAPALQVPDFLRNLSGVGQLVSVLLSNFFVVSGVTFLLLMIAAGYNMLTGAGDTQKYQRAVSIITTAVIGFVIVVGAYLIVRLIELMTGVHIVS